MSNNENLNTNNNHFKPYNFMLPQNMFLVFSFFSPFIVIFFFTFMGMYFSPFTGLLFLTSILVSLLIRFGIYKQFSFLTEGNSNICNLINYSGIGPSDIYLSLWVFSFTLFYIITPLIGNNGIQSSLYSFLSIFLFLFFGDIVVKSINGCFNFKSMKPINILLNIFLGGISGLLLSLGFSSSDALKKHLFFSSNSSSNETCKQVNDTKFQCSFDFE
jgi:hypothetical protein